MVQEAEVKQLGIDYKSDPNANIIHPLPWCSESEWVTTLISVILNAWSRSLISTMKRNTMVKKSARQGPFLIHPHQLEHLSSIQERRGVVSKYMHGWCRTISQHSRQHSVHLCLTSARLINLRLENV